jgi:gag-polypeptide of LTR copia-type
VSNSNGKIAFGIMKSCKSKEFEGGNAVLAWEKLKKKYDPISARSLVKTERMFREYRLGKNEEPEIWINSLEYLRIKLETMGSSMTDDQFIVQVLKRLTSDYELQMLLLEKQIGSKERKIDLAKELKIVKYLRVDNAGENFTLENLCKKQSINIQFEISGPWIPQRNGKVEPKFQILHGRI